MNFKIKLTKTLALSTLALMCVSAVSARTEAQADKKVAEVMAKMTLDEKLTILHGVGSDKGEFGDDGASSFGVAGVERLGIPYVYMGHGITGVRVGRDRTIKTTYMSAPTGVGTSWDAELYKRIGTAIAREMRALGQDLNLGPTINIIRNPLGGRTWESLSEDPFHSGKMVVPFSLAMKEEGIIVGPKHFAANNQETHRFDINNELDERTLREIYLPAFEMAVKEGGVLNLMGSYNRLNGEFMCQNRYVLTDILRNEWGFKGFVLSDFANGVRATVPAATAGLNVEMHGKRHYGPKMKAEIEKGNLKMEVVDELVREYLKVVYMMDIDTRKRNENYPIHSKESIALARELAENALVLLKNDGILPLDKSKKQSLAVIGPNAQRRGIGPGVGGTGYLQGEGSGRTYHFDNAVIEPIAAFKEISKGSVAYAQGSYSSSKIRNQKPETVASDNKRLIAEAVALAKKSDVAVLVIGLNGGNESEGFDRTSSHLPEWQDNLVKAVAAVNKNVVVYVVAGSYVDMSAWEDKVQAIVYVPYCGEQVAYAMADVFYGDVVPSGKMATTWPKKLSDFHPASIYTGEAYSKSGNKSSNVYSDGVFVGYRWFDKQKLEVSYPFGFGLSYTTFKYSNIKAKKKGNGYVVTVDIKNTGKYDAKEVAQLYVSDVKASVDRPINELKGFEKVSIKAGATETVTFELNDRSFAFYDVAKKDWNVEAGDFVISVGGSSRDLPVKTTITIK